MPSNFIALLSGPFARKLLGRSVIAFVIKVASAGLSFAMFVALARAMSPSEFGLFSIGFSLASFLALVALMGQRNLVLRFAPNYRAENKPAHLKGLMTFSYGVVLGASLFFAFLALIVSIAFPDLVPTYFLASAVLIAPLAVSDLQAAMYRSLGRVAGALAPRDVMWRLLVILCAVPAILGWNQPGFLIQMTPSMAIMVSVCVLLSIIAFQLIVCPELRHIVTAKVAPKRETTQWRYASVGLWLNTVLQNGFQHIAVVLLGLFLSPAEIGGFFAAAKTSLLLNFFLLAANLVSAPYITQFWKQKKRRDLQRLCSAVSIGAFVPTLVLFGVFVVFGREILAIFQPDYAAAYPVLIILSLGQLLSTACGQTGALLTMSGSERVLLRYVAVSNIAAICLIVVGVPFLGPVFAAVSLTLGLVGWNFLGASFAIRKLGTNPTLLGVLALAKTPS
ncbi:MAG: lipopolysaccharide biosynthesis protein [Pseudomonadota bacterium]